MYIYVCIYIHTYISKDYFTQRPLSFKTTGETRAVSDPVLKFVSYEDLVSATRNFFLVRDFKNMSRLFLFSQVYVKVLSEFMDKC